MAPLIVQIASTLLAPLWLRTPLQLFWIAVLWQTSLARPIGEPGVRPAEVT